jgi:hypothetical protein
MTSAQYWTLPDGGHMKHSSTYDRWARDYEELGRWKLADEFRAKARKARRIEKRKKANNDT